MRQLVPQTLVLLLVLISVSCSQSPAPQLNPNNNDGTETTSENDSDPLQSQDGGGSDDQITLPRPEAEWTVMLYMDADNDLEPVMLDDINEIESVHLKSDDAVNILVLIDRAEGYDSRDGDWTGAKIFWMRKNSSSGTLQSNRLEDLEFLGLSSISNNGEELDMGDVVTLEKFIDFSQKNFPASNYILHFNDHGDGWRKKKSWSPGTSPSPAVKSACFDESSGNALSLSEDIPSAVSDRGISAITFDACSMGTVEVAWALAPHIDYLGVSIVAVPSTGWDYERVFSTWLEDPSARNWVIRAVDQFALVHEDHPSVGFSALDLTGGMEDLRSAVDAFASKALDMDTAGFRWLRNTSYGPDWTQHSMKDLMDFASLCQRWVGSDVVEDLRSAIEGLTLSSSYASNLARLKGLVIYLPGTTSAQGGPYRASYDNTPFAEATNWDELIKAQMIDPTDDSTNVNTTD